MRDSKGRFIKGHKVPKEWREISSEKNKDYGHTIESKKKISDATKGDKNPAWKGGKEGYYRRLARVMLGTQGKDYNTNIHHIDGDVKNNSLSNLNVMTRSEHTRLHHNQGDIHGGD